MNRRIAFFGLCLFLLAVGCASFKVRHVYDTETDFARLKTYAWLPSSATAAGEALQARDPVIDKRIRWMVGEQLSQKGLSRSADRPDFLVTYHVTVEPKIEVDDWGYTYHARKRYYTAEGYGVVEVVQYEKGTLIIDFVDTTTRRLIWRGEAQGGLAPQLTEKQGEKIVDESVKGILKAFPPAK